MKRTIIIGDIHGCYDELVALLKKCERKPSDEVISIGDMVDRGPKPWEVVEFFLGDPNACAILGNHEDKHIRIREGEFGPSRSQFITKKQMGTHYEKAVDYFETLPLWEEREGYLLVHAGARPNIPVHEQEKDVLIRSKPGWWTTFNDTIKVIYGHYKHEAPHVENGTIGIDTGCYQGRKLTAFILPESCFVQVDAKTDYWGGIVLNKYQKEWAKWREEKTGKPQKQKTKLGHLEVDGIQLNGDWVKEQYPEKAPGLWVREVLQLLDEKNQEEEFQTLEAAERAVQEFVEES